MGFELFTPQAAATGRHSVPALMITKKGIARLNRAAMLAMKMEEGGRCNLYVDREKCQIGFDVHEKGMVRVCKTSGASRGLCQAVIAAGAEMREGAYPINKVDLAPVTFAVNLPRKRGPKSTD